MYLCQETPHTRERGEIGKEATSGKSNLPHPHPCPCPYPRPCPLPCSCTCPCSSPWSPPSVPVTMLSDSALHNVTLSTLLQFSAFWTVPFTRQDKTRQEDFLPKEYLRTHPSPCCSVVLLSASILCNKTCIFLLFSTLNFVLGFHSCWTLAANPDWLWDS